jgi:hypothetical protein
MGYYFVGSRHISANGGPAYLPDLRDARPGGRATCWAN